MIESQKFFLVGLGGALGSMLRYFVGRLFFASNLASGFPLQTLLVNLLGCFLIGLLASLFSGEDNQLGKLFLITGILGGFTTFSAFGLETVELLKSEATLAAASYIFFSVVIGMLAVFAGMALAAGLKH